MSKSFTVSMFAALDAADLVFLNSEEADHFGDAGVDEEGRPVIRLVTCGDEDYFFADQQVTVNESGACTVLLPGGARGLEQANEVTLLFKMTRPMREEDVL